MGKNQNKRDRGGDTNYMKGRGVNSVSGVTRGYRPAHADRAQVYEAARAAVIAFSQYLVFLA